MFYTHWNKCTTFQCFSMQKKKNVVIFQHVHFYCRNALNFNFRDGIWDTLEGQIHLLLLHPLWHPIVSPLPGVDGSIERLGSYTGRLPEGWGCAGLRDRWPRTPLGFIHSLSFLHSHQVDMHTSIWCSTCSHVHSHYCFHHIVCLLHEIMLCELRAR